MSTATTTRVQAPADSVNITNKPEVIAAAKRAAELKAIEKAAAAAKKEREALEASVLRPALGNARYAILRGVKAYELSTPRSNTHLDKNLVLEMAPEVYQAALVKTPFDFITYNV